MSQTPSIDDATLDQFVTVVRRFFRERLRPLEPEVAADDRVPEGVYAEMRDLGLFGLSVPEAYGGLGLSMEGECRIAFETGAASPAFRNCFGTNIGIGSQAIVMVGSEAQKMEWLPRIASGEIITAFCLTEAEVGSDGGAVRTRAVREGDTYRLTGAKRFITNADRAGLFTVMARTGDEGSGARGVSAFLVPAGSPGLSVGRPERKMGQHGTHVCDVVFDDVEVPASNRLGAEGEGFQIAKRVLDRGRLHLAAVAVGVAERLIGDMLAYAAGRRQFGRPIAEFQLVQGLIADSQTEYMAARALVLETARRRDAGAAVVLDCAACKYFATEMVGRVADRAVQVFGGAGYVADYGIERLYRDVRLFRIYEGTSQIQQIVIAKELLRQAAVS